MGQDFNTICSFISTPLFATGILILLITIGSTSSTNIIVMMTGYGFIITGCITMIVLFLGANQINISTLFSIIPFVLIITLICFLLHSIKKNFDKIVNNHLSNGYFVFTNLFVLITALDIMIVYLGMQDKKFKETFSLSKVYILLLYLFLIVGTIIYGNINIILENFNSDG